MVNYPLLFVCFFCIFPGLAFSQETANNNSAELLTLPQCINYALDHQPALKQAKINESITKATNAINLSGWLPQVNATGTLTHYDQLPTSFQTNPNNPNGPPNIVKAGIPDAATPQISATQVIFSPTLFYAAKTAHLYNEEARLITDSTKINLVATVSKSFYGLLLTLEQINVLKEDTVRLAKNLTDAYNQYIGGIVDETDYEEATITLNNSLAQLRQATENIVPLYANLKQLMGYPPEQQFNISFDTSKMISEINIDTTARLQFEKRIEYQQLSIAKQIQHKLIDYYHTAYLPTVSGFFNYTYEFGSTTVGSLFDVAYPYSSIGLSVNLPLFTGFSRIQNVRKAKLQEQLLDWSETNLKSQIYSEYTTAMANYRSNLYNFQIMQKNEVMAQRVYYVVRLQYEQGIVAYLNVITAESNLITSEIGYINALFQVLSNKIDLEKSMGVINY